MTPSATTSRLASTSVRILIALALTIGLSRAVVGQRHVTLERGFAPDKVYDFGEIDHVNKFNGNLVVTLPIASFAVGGKVSYGAVLVWNSKLWTFRERRVDDEVAVTRAEVDKNQSAAFGWQLMVGGRLLFPFSPQNPSGKWVLLTPDGGEHAFVGKLHADDPGMGDPNVSYTTDGTYYRMRDIGVVREVDTPDGTTMSFSELDGRILGIRDRYPTPNTVTISYNGDDFEVRDSARGQSVVTLKAITAPSGIADSTSLQRVLQKVQVYTPTGVQEYTVSTANADVSRDCRDDDPQTPPLVKVPLLTGLNLPDGSSYSIPVSDYNLTGCDESGLIRGLRLPTWGRIEYSWQPYTLLFTFVSSEEPGFAPPSAFQVSPGIASRRLVKPNGAIEGTWTYSTQFPQLSQPGPLGTVASTELENTLTDPEGNRTESFFSVYPWEASSSVPAVPNPEGWTVTEMGLPMTRYVTAAGTSPPMYLSSRQYDSSGALLRSNYVRYEYDFRPTTSNLVHEGKTDVNRREAASRVVFDDDGGRVADVHRSMFDGVGNYRRVQTGGSFGSGDVRITHRDYNLPRGTYPGAFSPVPISEPWLLNTFTAEWAQEGGQTAKRTYKIEASTGWVERTRIHRRDVATPGPGDVAQDTRDVVVETPRDLSGNLLRERFFGGDLQTLSTQPVETMGLPGTPDYRIEYTTSYGARASATYYTSGGQPFGFKTLDCTIDPATSQPSRCLDTAGVGTSYEYDVLGRLRWVKPDEEAWTEYLYTRATSAGSLARVNVFRRQNATAGPLAEQVYRFDGFGRLVQEQEWMPNGTYATRDTIYNALGWTTSVSEWGANAGAGDTQLTYDAFGRPRTITPPDDPNHVTTFIYAGVRSVRRRVSVGRTYSAPNVTEQVAETEEIYDRQGRLVRVTEPANPNGTNTSVTYSYDVGNRLSEVTQSTAVGTQTRTFTYDQRGFLQGESHPEKTGSCSIDGGATRDVCYSSYDSRGHAGQKVDGPFALFYTFDDAERTTLIEELEPGTTSQRRALKQFTYGSAGVGARTNGRLRQASRYQYPDGLGIGRLSEVYDYGGGQGRVSQRDTQWNHNGADFQRFRQTWQYNLLGEVLLQGYPNCTTAVHCNGAAARSVDYTRSRGKLTAIPGFAPSITYHPNGLYNLITHANGVVDTQLKFGHGMARPRDLYSQLGATFLWRSGAYEYDGAGNVKKAGDNYWLYDGVGRIRDGHVMEGPTGGGRQRWQTYDYDGFGNLLSIGGDTWSSGRSTPTSASTNRLTSGAHDDAGNLLSWNGNSYSYDAFGMMTRSVLSGADRRYIYTADDERFWTFQVGGGNSTFELRDLDGKVVREYQAHLSWATVKDYIYPYGQLLATVHPDEGVRHLHLDHLGTPRLVTGATNVAEDGFYTVTPCRAYDTRTGPGPLVAGETRTVTLVGSCDIPATAAAVSVNLTAVQPNSTGDLTAFPANESAPGTSAISFTGGEVRANNGVFKLGAGALAFRNNQTAGQVDLVIDVNGYFIEATTAQALTYHVYFPFGEEVGSFSQDLEQMKFTGHERDFNNVTSVADELDYMRARFYNPQLGRFLSADIAPAQTSRPQSWNRYAYVQNNPLKFLDPDGQAAVAAVAVAWGAAEVGLTAYDVYDTTQTIRDPNASTLKKGTAVGLTLLGVVSVGGGLTAADDLAKAGARIAANAAAGRAFEAAGREALELGAKSGASVVAEGLGKSIPDFLGRGIIEFKHQQRISLSLQLRIQSAWAKLNGAPLNLVVSPGTKYISRPLLRQISDTGGRVFVFDPKTGTFGLWAIP